MLDPKDRQRHIDLSLWLRMICKHGLSASLPGGRDPGNHPMDNLKVALRSAATIVAFLMDGQDIPFIREDHNEGIQVLAFWGWVNTNHRLAWLTMPYDVRFAEGVANTAINNSSTMFRTRAFSCGDEHSIVQYHVEPSFERKIASPLDVNQILAQVVWLSMYSWAFNVQLGCASGEVGLEPVKASGLTNEQIMRGVEILESEGHITLVRPGRYLIGKA